MFTLSDIFNFILHIILLWNVRIIGWGSSKQLLSASKTTDDSTDVYGLRRSRSQWKLA